VIRVKGKDQPTIQDAAEHLGVSTKTVRSWIDKGVIQQPETVEWGTRNVEVFPDRYLVAAAKAVKQYRVDRRPRFAAEKGYERG
jgi:excisionase family DNA binding protein